jgi:hypothetical protein
VRVIVRFHRIAIPRVCVASVCAAALCAPSHRTAAACGIHSSARTARCGRARVVAFGATGRLSRASAAGVTWTCRTANAEWAARSDHTSVVDAFSGAIYVIGGWGTNNDLFNDVWASTDGGVRAGPGPRGGSGGTPGDTQVGYSGVLRVLRGYKGYYGVLQGSTGGAKGY